MAAVSGDILIFSQFFSVFFLFLALYISLPTTYSLVSSGITLSQNSDFEKYKVPKSGTCIQELEAKRQSFLIPWHRTGR